MIRVYMRVMYVCLCHAVKDSEVRQAVASGAEDVDKLAELLGVGSGCGSCREFAQALVDEYAEDGSLASPA